MAPRIRATAVRVLPGMAKYVNSRRRAKSLVLVVRFMLATHVV
ncbi:MAG TPA: hypothetical protein VGM05_00345 [Planctomycetaceae bacterium]